MGSTKAATQWSIRIAYSLPSFLYRRLYILVIVRKVPFLHSTDPRLSFKIHPYTYKTKVYKPTK